MRIKVTRKDLLWNYCGTIFSMCSNFLLLPFLVRYLSGAELGLWYVYIAIGNMVMLFEFGFNPTFARNFAFCWSGASILTKEGCVRSVDDAINPSLLAHLLAACRMVYCRITVAAFLVLALPGTLYISSITGSHLFKEVLASWGVYVAGVLLNLFYLYYAAMLRGIGCIAADNQIKIAARLTQLFITSILLFFGLGLTGAAIGFLANSLVYRVLGYRKFWHNDDIMRLELKTIDISKIKKTEIYKIISYNAYKDGAVQISNYASTQASSLICSSYLGLEQSGIYSIALQFATAIGNMALSYMNSCRPMMQSDYQRGNLESLRKSMGKCAIVYVALYLVMVAAVLFFAYPFLGVLKPETQFDPLIFTGVSIYMFIFNWCALFSSMLSNMNSIPYVKSYIISAVAGIGLSVLFVSELHLGAWGLILGFSIPQVAYNVWKWPSTTVRRLNTNLKTLLFDGMHFILKQ